MVETTGEGSGYVWIRKMSWVSWGVFQDRGHRGSIRSAIPHYRIQLTAPDRKSVELNRFAAAQAPCVS